MDSLDIPQNTQLLKGLVTQTSPNNQPEGTWRYALNLVNETRDGDKGFVANEYGNSACKSLTINGKTYIPNGAINLLDDEVILTLATLDKNDSRIVLQKGCTITDIVYTKNNNSAACLNFSLEHPVTGIAKIRKGCNRVIYFRDSYNSDRSIDIDEILNTPNTNRYYTDSTGWNCAAFKLAPDFEFPCISYVKTNDAGGSLRLGMYQFAISLGDEDLNFTSVLSTTQPVPIVSGLLTGTFINIEGGDPLKENSPEIKSIDLRLSNIDTTFSYVKIYAIETVAGVTTAYEADTLPINGVAFNYTYRGLDYNTATIVPLADINVDYIVYDKSRTMTQQDQRLLRGNLEERNIDYAALQIAANKIKTRYITKPIIYNLLESDQSGSYYSDNRTYMRDEIYALGIEVVFLDGTRSAVLHIPGRAANTSTLGGTLPPYIDPFGPAGSKEHNRKAPIGEWDTSNYTVGYAKTTPKLPLQPPVDKSFAANMADWYNPQIVPPANSTDPGVFGTLPPTVVSIEDARPFAKNIGDTIERWRMYNTAYRDEQKTLTDTYYSKGQMAYWESEFDYPDTMTCAKDGRPAERIYPDGKIRHHKFPDTTLEPHFVNTTNSDLDTYILSMGLEFDLTEFKAELQSRLGSKYDEISGFRISRAKRDRGNKSILDKGLAYRMLEGKYYVQDGESIRIVDILAQNNHFNKNIWINRNFVKNEWSQLNMLSWVDKFQTGRSHPIEELVPIPGANNDDLVAYRYSNSYLSIHNPKAQFTKESSFQYIKMEKELFGSYDFYGDRTTWDNNENSTVTYRVNYLNKIPGLNISSYHGTPLYYFTNRVKYDDYLASANEDVLFDGRQYLGKTNQDTYISKIDNFPDISNLGGSYGGGPKELDGSTYNWKPFGNILYPPEYALTNWLPITPYLDLAGGGPGFQQQNINEWINSNISQYSKAYYISLKDYNPGIYNQLNTITYYPVHSCLISPNSTSATLFGGDCFISQVASRMTNTDRTYPNTLAQPPKNAYYQCLYNYFVESEINCKLRHEGYEDTDYAGWYYPKHGLTTNQILDVLIQNDYLLTGATDETELIDAVIEGNYCYNQYNYNTDYSKENTLKPNFPLAIGYDYCNVCNHKFPYRIAFSQKSFQEETSDAYRLFLANNYRELSGSTGEIYNLFREHDTLYARTKQSLWYIPTKQQELTTTEGNIHIGTGDFFSLPPKEIVSTTIGYNGGQTSLDLIVNEYGAIYADTITGAVFLTKTGTGQQEISNRGNRFWFKLNLPFNLLNSYPSFPVVDAPTSPVGIGLLGYYDAKTRRYILTKKDYVPLSINATFNSTLNAWVIPGINRNPPTIVTNPYDRKDLFENKSWTISYSLEDDMWLSWHSYLPNFAWNTRSNFFTSIVGNPNIWVHDNQNLQSYYGEKQPHVFEFVSTINPLMTKIADGVSYISDVQEYSPFTKQWVQIINDTYNKGIFYNSSQSTGELDIVVKNNIDPFASVLRTFDPGEILAERTESNWSINQLRDMTDQTTPNQSLFKSDWDSIKNSYYADKVPNSSILNYLTKSQFEMEKLRDNYLISRLSYKPIQNRRIITKYLTNKNSISIR